MHKETKSSREQLPNPVIPRWEALIYVCVWIVFAGKCVYALFNTSKDYTDHRLVNYELRDGWKILSRQQDVSDHEWQFWQSSMVAGLWKWFLCHILIGQIVRWTHLFHLRKYLFIMYSLIFFISLMGFRTMVLLLIEVLVTCLVAWFTASPILVWIVAIGFLSILNITVLTKFVVKMGFLYSYNSEYFLFQEYFLSMAMLRFTSCALYIVESERNKYTRKRPNECDIQRESKSDPMHQDQINTPRKTFPDICEFVTNEARGSSARAQDLAWDCADMFCYMLYLPLAISGPLMTFDDFLFQFNKPLSPWTVSRLMPISKSIFRFLFWAFAYEFSTHYLYNSAMIHKASLLENLPLWSMASIGYMSGQFFMVKYLVIWSMFSAMARLDQLVTPQVPSCISHIYLYSEIWKSFDRGLYGFMKQHIYYLLGGSQHGLIRQTFALMACFSFVYLWHGMADNIFWWTFLNFIALMLEAIAGQISRTEFVKKLESKLSPSANRRIRSIIIMPVLLMSTISIFIFFGGVQSGFVIFYRISFEGAPVSLLLVTICCYCLIQTGKEVENWKAGRRKCKEL